MKKILVVDDEMETDFIFKAIFEKEIKELKLEIVYYSDAKKCLETILEHPEIKYDYLFSDINMPVFSGIQFVRELRNRRYQGQVILISAYSKNEYLNEIEELEISHFIEKPINFKNVKAILNLS